MQEEFRVPDVSCAHCKSAIEGALQPLHGVERALVDVDRKVVTVQFDDTVVGRSEVVQAIEQVGYPVAS